MTAGTGKEHYMEDTRNETWVFNGSPAAGNGQLSVTMNDKVDDVLLPFRSKRLTAVMDRVNMESELRN